MSNIKLKNAATPNEINSNFGVNIAGYVSSEFGLGEMVRSTIRAVEAANVPFALNNLTFDKMHRQEDQSFTKFSEDNPFPINIIHVNGDMMHRFLETTNPNYFKNKYNIGFWAWELPDFPSGWLSSLYLFNEIWTLSNYCADTISQVSPVPVLNMFQCRDLPEPEISREQAGLPTDKFIFLFMFDFCSVFERKNPTAVVEAFRQAFGTDERVLLIIKSSNGDKFHEKFKLLKSAAGNAPNIKLIDGFLDKKDLYSLIYNCDAYVSLHRSEGFGLTMAEAMYYGKPTIGSAYSANTEFMNIGNSFPVRYELRKLEIDYAHYKKGSYWAEPDVSHAAQLMRHIFEHPAEARAIAQRGAAEIKVSLSPQTIGNKYKKRLEHIAALNDNFRHVSQPLDKLPQLARMKIELQGKEAEIERLTDKINLMKESSFWKIRSHWFRVKNFGRKNPIPE